MEAFSAIKNDVEKIGFTFMNNMILIKTNQQQGSYVWNYFF